MCHVHSYSLSILLEQMNKGKSNDSAETTIESINKVGELFPSATLEDYAELSRDDDEDDNDEGRVL